ncbi:hypothetical protein C8Q80DRAFT_1297970 [Daedaleopsis nitida]|nr:hypothetical protein C8Q80DRAFT_1297970 [Daedaleopsis nitida]
MGWRDVAFTLGAVAVLVPSSWISSAHAGNTTCASQQMDWYTSVVGESPCATYERLRQICNPDYQVPDFLPMTPGDRCNDQVSSCCCNSVAFQLSMLCKNCQYVKVDGSTAGYDAGEFRPSVLPRSRCPHTIAIYKHPDRTQQSSTISATRLPGDVQQAVCNKDIRLDNYLYGGWEDGACVWTKENAVKEHAANSDNTFTHCANQISPSVTPTPTTTKPDNQNNSKTDSPPVRHSRSFIRFTSPYTITLISRPLRLPVRVTPLELPIRQSRVTLQVPRAPLAQLTPRERPALRTVPLAFLQL